MGSAGPRGSDCTGCRARGVSLRDGLDINTRRAQARNNLGRQVGGSSLPSMPLRYRNLKRHSHGIRAKSRRSPLRWAAHRNER